MSVPQLTLTFVSYGRTVTVTPQFLAYANGRTALCFNENDGEPFGVATVNMPNDHLNDGEVFIKDWSENEPLIKAMLAAGWIELTGRNVQSGYVFPKVARFAGDLLEYFNFHTA